MPAAEPLRMEEGEETDAQRELREKEEAENEAAEYEAALAQAEVRAKVEEEERVIREAEELGREEEELARQEQEAAEEDEELAYQEEEDRKRTLFKSHSAPAPIEPPIDRYAMRKKPIWSMTSPDRKNVDLMLGTWTPASSSLQPRAPDPGGYNTEGVGKNGKFTPAKWSFAKNSGRPCLAPPPPEKPEIHLAHVSTLGGWHPTARKAAQWSVFGIDRTHLPHGTKTWTPQPVSEMRPGPGTYATDRAPKWKASSRKGTIPGRQANLHPDVKAWAPTSLVSRQQGGEAVRLGFRPPKLKPLLHPSMFSTH